jgi:hypothetical protein
MLLPAGNTGRGVFNNSGSRICYFFHSLPIFRLPLGAERVTDHIQDEIVEGGFVDPYLLELRFRDAVHA